MTIITKNDDGTVTLTAPVMIPGAKDCDYHNGETPLTTEQVKEFAESYKKYGFIDHEHGLTRNGRKIGTPANSFLLTENTTMQTLNGPQTYPSGTWMVTSTLTDHEAIQTALRGGYTGYSPSVLPRTRADAYLEALKSDPNTRLPCSCKNVSSAGNSLIRDVPEPVVLSISLVRSPCLHESKFCEVNGDMMEEDVKSLKSKVLSAMGMSEEAEVVALKSEVSELKKEIEGLKADFNESLKSMQESFEQTLTKALTPVAEKGEEEGEADEEAEEPVEVEEAEEQEKEEVVEEETQEEEEAEPIAEKGHSKAEPIHDNIQAEKAKKINIYEFMGRNADGTRKH